jgi:hypothetical protein
MRTANSEQSLSETFAACDLAESLQQKAINRRSFAHLKAFQTS